MSHLNERDPEDKKVQQAEITFSPNLHSKPRTCSITLKEHELKTGND